MQAAVYERLELANELRRAVERDEFVVYYQPIVEIATQRIVGTEALVRWDHPQRGPQASGLVHPRGRGDGAHHPHRRLRARRGLPPARRVADELEAAATAHVGQPLPAPAQGPRSWSRRSATALASSGIDPARLTLEITETALVEDSYATLARLQRAQGARHTPVDRRLRHRLLVAELPAPVPRGRREDRQALRGPRRRRRRTTPLSRGPSSPSARRSSSRSWLRGSSRSSRCTSCGSSAASSARASTRHAPSTRRASPSSWRTEAAAARSPAAAGRGADERRSARDVAPVSFGLRNRTQLRAAAQYVVDAVVFGGEEVVQAGPQAAASHAWPFDVEREGHHRLLPEIVGIGVRPGQLLEAELDVETLGPQARCRRRCRGRGVSPRCAQPTGSLPS